MTREYPVRQLGDVIRLMYGKPLPEADRTATPGVPAFGANGILCWSKKAYRTDPSIIVGRKGSAGEVNLADGPFWPTDVTYFVEHDQCQTDLKYIFYVLKHLNLPELAKGVKPGINRNDVYALEVPVPNLSEQKRLVALLDGAFEGIARATANFERNLSQVRLLSSTIEGEHFARLLSEWPLVSLGDVCTFENGDRGPNYPGKQHRVAEGIPFINAGHLTPSGIDYSTMDYISAERFAMLGHGKIRTDDVLFCLRGSLGKFACVGALDAGAIASSLVIIRPQRTLNLDYLLAYLGSSMCAAMIDRFKGGAAQPNLGAKDLKKFQLPLPSLTVQALVADRLSEVSANVLQLEHNYRAELSACDELKHSLLHKAFSGQLTPEKAIAA